MKSITSLILSVPMLVLITFSSSCATSQAALQPPPRLELRVLRFSKDAPELLYQYPICVKKFLGVCTREEMKVERFDLTDPAVRSMLVDTGFVARVREKPLQ
jgi:hypothetical protein